MGAPTAAAAAAAATAAWVSAQKNAQVHLGVRELGRTVAGMIRIVKIYCRCRPDQKGG